ncbi:hypothetical protein BKA24_001796 [Microbacterium marinum]|uniref:Uncharacterized protein n=1 Tax=Microbacterium marinum TaxID=421115 RepID=A0A7W7FIH3_9MICO|nr:hypothetical protein [Microbacterium marinum]MBB4667087.1 hypothetical protein [Microbacterium marinum]
MTTQPFWASAAAWFTDSRRAALQALIASSLTLLAVTGLLNQEQSFALGELSASLLLLIQGVIGLSLLRDSEWSTWLGTKGRALLYGAATALGPVGIAFQLWGSEVSAQIATIATIIASIATAFVQTVNVHTLSPGEVEVLDLPEDVREVIAQAVAQKAGGSVAEMPVEPTDSNGGTGR